MNSKSKRQKTFFYIGKFLKKLTAAVSLIVLPLSAAIADINQIYLEQGGYVHFEAEDAATTGSWAVNTSLSNYTGEGYLEWAGPNHFFEANAGNGTITYHFRIETPGNYELRWRNRIAHGESQTESNDTWARFSTGRNIEGEEPLSGWSKVFMGEFGVWSWSARTVDHVANPVRQFFSQGEHTIEISGRSFGHAIDRIALYRYEDVNFDPGLNGTLALSQFARQDGSIVDPNPIIHSPSESATETTTNTTTDANSEQNPEQNPEQTSIVENELADRSNVEIALPKASESHGSYCVADTLTLPVLDAASLNSTISDSTYNRDEITLEADTSRALLTFDLSQLPIFSSAKLMYPTGSEISNGSLEIYLGSHSDWRDSSNAAVPDATVKIADAQGGWNSDSYYATDLNASLLPRQITTLILSVSTGSDPLQLSNTNAEQALPVLALSGDSNFCADFQTTSQHSSQSSLATEPTTIVRRSGGSLGYLIVALLITASLRRKLS